LKLSLQWKWFGALAILLAALLLVINLCIDFFLSPYLFERIRADLERNAILASEVFESRLRARPAETWEINALAHAIAKRTGVRVTVIAPDGMVIAESDKPQNQLKSIENHLNRPEVQAAIQRGIGSATRHSDTIHVDLLYVAVAMRQENLLGIVRVAIPLHEIKQTTDRVQHIVAMASMVVGIVAIPFLFWMARRTSGPIDEMRRMAMRVAQGDFEARAPTQIKGELGELGRALNEMAGQLENRLRELAKEQAELHATLASMIEGVLLVDATGKIRLANHAILHQFHLADAVLGKTVMEVFRSTALHDVVSRTLAGREVRDLEVPFFGQEEHIFHVNAACLQVASGACIGAVVVFHDITRLKQLENMRKEFVANVSHELRTPLSMIKGYVETLLDEQPPDQQTARQFVQTIQKHSNRLEALIDDLLTISALESQQTHLHFEPASLHAIATDVMNEFAQPARTKSVSLSMEIPGTFPRVKADIQRLNQVFSNLLDNAIKYTQSGGHIRISAKENKAEVEVCIADNGPGIPPEHLPHIFERFYRVEKARNRELGGTGLGLSIVKHIVQAHGGRVWAESKPGKGSWFFFTLPRSRD